MINNVYQEMVDLVSQGGKVLFVGTKRQAQEVSRVKPNVAACCT
jgi:ribosomal protein S2